MDALRRLRFIAVSALGIAALAFMGALAGGLAYPIAGVPWGKRVVNDSPGFPIGAVVFGVLAVALQLSRIIASRRRSGRALPEPYRASWRELQTNVQFKALLAVLAVAIVGGVWSYVVSG